MACRYEEPEETATNALKENAKLTAMLCAVLTVLERGLSIDSAEDAFFNIDPVESGVAKNELRDWWRDHRQKDRERQARERQQREHDMLRSRALAKLTPEECKALGVAP